MRTIKRNISNSFLHSIIGIRKHLAALDILILLRAFCMSHRANKDYRIHVAVLVAILLIVAAISFFIPPDYIISRSPNPALKSCGSKGFAGWREYIGTRETGKAGEGARFEILIPKTAFRIIEE